MERTLKECNRCGHTWLSRIEPKYCPNCCNPYWNKPRVKDIPDARKAKRVSGIVK